MSDNSNICIILSLASLIVFSHVSFCISSYAKYFVIEFHTLYVLLKEPVLNPLGEHWYFYFIKWLTWLVPTWWLWFQPWFHFKVLAVVFEFVLLCHPSSALGLSGTWRAEFSVSLVCSIEPRARLRWGVASGVNMGMPQVLLSSHCVSSVFRFFGISFDSGLEIRCSSFPWTLKILILTVVAMNRGLFLHFPLSIWLLTSRFEAALDIGWESSCCLITKLCLDLKPHGL